MYKNIITTKNHLMGMFAFLSICLIYTLSLIYKLFNRINHDIVLCKDSYIHCGLSYYPFIFPLFFIDFIIIYLIRCRYGKKRTLNIISIYTLLNILALNIISYVLLILAFGGLGNLPIYEFLPIKFLLYSIIALTTKYSIFNMAIYILLIYIIYMLPNKIILNIKKRYIVNFSYVLITYLFLLVFSFVITYNGISFLLTYLILIFPLCISLKPLKSKMMINLNRFFLTLFFYTILYPCFHYFIFESKSLLNFAFL